MIFPSLEIKTFFVAGPCTVRCWTGLIPGIVVTPGVFGAIGLVAVAVLTGVWMRETVPSGWVTLRTIMDCPADRTLRFAWPPGWLPLLGDSSTFTRTVSFP